MTSALTALGLYTFAILSIGLTEDWRLLHEDNGAMHTTRALSHLRLGVRTTRAHDVFYNPRTGHLGVDSHHPPATALLIAGAFALTGSDAPWVARGVSIVFHLGSVFLLVALLAHLVGPRPAVAGGFLMATLPMGAYFGRMVNYEPLCLFAILLQLEGYIALKREDSTWPLVRLVAGIVLGGLIDWPAFFFAAAIAAAEAIDVLRGRARSFTPLAAVVVAAIATFLVDVWHLWYAGGGNLGPLGRVLAQNLSPVSPGKFANAQVTHFRKYYTDVGLVASVIALLVWLPPRAGGGRVDIPSVVRGAGGALVRRCLAVSGAAALAYVLAAPSWATYHPYWKFYFQPYVVLSIVLLGLLMWRRIAERRSLAWVAVGVILAVDIVVGAATTLHYRYTHPSSYAIKMVERFRADYLVPASLNAGPTSR